jgi:hypothetical protein
MANGEDVPFGLSSSGEMSSYTPTLRERATDWLARNWYGDSRAGTRKAERLLNVADFTPFGLAPMMYDAGRALGSGDYLKAGLSLGMAIAPGPNPKIRNGRKILGHRKGAQPSELLSSVQQPPKPKTEKMSSSILERELGKYFPGYRKEVSKSISERHGPSISAYYHIDTPYGRKTIRLSDHSYPNNAAVDLQYGGDADIELGVMFEQLNLPVPKKSSEKLYELRMTDYRQKIDLALKRIANETPKAQREMAVRELLRNNPPPQKP